jgi:hypothetical protein
VKDFLNPIQSRVTIEKTSTGIIEKHWGNDMQVQLDLWKQYYEQREQEVLLKLKVSYFQVNLG